MSKLNQIECVNNLKNTGFGTCVFDPKLIAGVLLFPTARTFTAEQLAEIEATLRAAATADTKTERMFPLHQFVGVTDNTEDVIIQTFPYGKKAVVRDGDYDWTFQFTDGALCLLTAAQTFNGNTPFLIYDKNNTIIGTTKDGLLSTIPPQFFYAMPWRVATGDAVAQYMIRLVFNAQYINQKLGFVPAGFDLSEIEGLKDVSIEENSFDDGTGVANVTVSTLCNKTNLFTQFSTELSDEDLWLATNKETGEEIVITSVAPVAGTKSFDVTFDTGDDNYPDAGGSILLTLAAPSVLSEADIEGYEAVELEIEIPAS